MQISTERHYKVAFSPVKYTLITLVGVGGTGSALAVDLARLVYHCREQGVDIRLQLIDHDHVEMKNVGRQQFSAAEIGQNKAVSMARRLNAWLAIDAVALPEKFFADTPLISRPGSGSFRRIIVGAVDNHEARAEIAELMELAENLVRWGREEYWWIDCGNGEYTGQILVGNVNGGTLQSNEEMGLVRGLPSPALQMPQLLQPEQQLPLPTLDCATGVMLGEQSLHINRLMAVYAAQLITDIVVRRHLETMRVNVSIVPPSVTSIPITRRTLSVLKQSKEA